MQRNIAIGVVAVLFAGIGFFLMKSDKKETSNDVSPGTSSEEMSTGSDKGSIIGNALDAFKSGKKMKCFVRDASSGTETSFYSEGKKFKSVSMVNGSGYATIFDGTTYYSWDEKTKQGMKFTEACMKDWGDQVAKTSGDTSVSNTPSTPKDTPEEILGNTDDDTVCESVAVIDFSVPSDIKFSDQCEAMKQTQEVLKNMEGAGIPDFSKMNIPGYSAQ